MIDMADVQNTIVNLISSKLFNQIDVQGVKLATSFGPTVAVYAGWPTTNALDLDLLNADRIYEQTGSVAPSDYICHISVNADAHMSENTTTWFQHDYQLSTLLPSLTVTTSSISASFGGSISSSDIIGMSCTDKYTFKKTYNYRPSTTDTLDSITSLYSTVIPSASLVNGVIEWPSSITVEMAVYCDQIITRVIRRQEQRFRIAIWCPTAGLRNSLSPIVDSAINNHPFGLIINGIETGPLIFQGIHEDDTESEAHLWRRDYIYRVDYPTINETPMSPIIIIDITTKLNPSPGPAPIPDPDPGHHTIIGPLKGTLFITD